MMNDDEKEKETKKNLDTRGRNGGKREVQVERSESRR